VKAGAHFAHPLGYHGAIFRRLFIPFIVGIDYATPVAALLVPPNAALAGLVVGLTPAPPLLVAVG